VNADFAEKAEQNNIIFYRSKVKAIIMGSKLAAKEAVKNMIFLVPGLDEAITYCRS
jgi:propionyl-CoA carboxylase alpha chain